MVIFTQIVAMELKSQICSFDQSNQPANEIPQVSKYSLGWIIKLYPQYAFIQKKRSKVLHSNFSPITILTILFQEHFNFNQFSQMIIFTSFLMKAFQGSIPPSTFRKVFSDSHQTFLSHIFFQKHFQRSLLTDIIV